jgi:hypothetical protein
MNSISSAHEDHRTNEHLAPVFELILPELECAGIGYWVYGGIGVAACAGEFMRNNGDVDIFIREAGFDRVRALLLNICGRARFEVKYKRLRSNRRPKLEVIEGREILSVVPVYVKDNMVEFRFSGGTVEYPRQMLRRVERRISNYRFFTPPDEYIARLFKTYLAKRPRVKARDKVRIDAKAILAPGEFQELMG